MALFEIDPEILAKMQEKKAHKNSVQKIKVEKDAKEVKVRKPRVRKPKAETPDSVSHVVGEILDSGHVGLEKPKRKPRAIKPKETETVSEENVEPVKEKAPLKRKNVEEDPEKPKKPRAPRKPRTSEADLDNEINKHAEKEANKEAKRLAAAAKRAEKKAAAEEKKKKEQNEKPPAWFKTFIDQAKKIEPEPEKVEEVAKETWTNVPERKKIVNSMKTHNHKMYSMIFRR